jgi:hypothetical protein
MGRFSQYLHLKNRSCRGFMNPSPRAAIARISILLLLTCAVALGWETSKNSGLQPVVGHVVKVKRVFAGRGGDGKEFTIRYSLQGKNFYLVTRRGILDSLGTLRGLQRGDSVPAVLAAVFGVSVAVLGLTGRV